MNSGLQPSSVQSFLDSSGGKNPSSLLHLKHMQISKPLQKSSVADPSMTEEEVNMRFIQDLLTWVEEMQVSWMYDSFKLRCVKNILNCISFLFTF